jgi:resuscitation-promoting factor RpfB
VADWFGTPEWSVGRAAVAVVEPPPAPSEVDRSQWLYGRHAMDWAYAADTQPGRLGRDLGWDEAQATDGGLAGLGLGGPSGHASENWPPANWPPEHWEPEHWEPEHWALRQRQMPEQPSTPAVPARPHAGERSAARGRHAAAGRRDPGEFNPAQFGGQRGPTWAGRHDARSSVRHPVKIAIYGVVLAGLVGGAGAWASLDKSVTISVDGQVRGLHTYAGTVAGVLEGAGISVGEHDILAPGADAPVRDGSEIVLRRGRLLRLTVDGRPRVVWVTATSVEEALNQIGFRQSGLYLSASRSRRLPLEGLSLEIRTAKTVTVVADGHTRRIVTTALSVGEMLEENAVRIGHADRVSQLAAARVVDGMRITVTRVRYKKVVTRTVITFKEIEKADPTLPQGTRKISVQGVDGLQEVTHLITYLDGRAASNREVAVRLLTKPVDQVVLVGTQPVQSGPVPAYGGLNWEALAQCESGGDPRAINPAGPYYGLYQFDLGTWQANGGSGNPIDASPEEQTRVAYNLYLARGREPWPVCGKYL